MSRQQYFLNIPGLKDERGQNISFSVRSLNITEALGQLYQLKLTVTSVDAVDLLRVLDQPAVFAVCPVDEEGLAAGLPLTEATLPPARKWHGVIREATRVSFSADETAFEVLMGPRLARLTDVIDTRLYQNLDVPALIAKVLREDIGLTGQDFVIKTSRAYPVHEHLTRWQENGLVFLKRWCEASGLFFWFEQTDDHEVIVFGDDQSHYLKPRQVHAFRADAGLESGTAEAVMDLRVTTRPVRGKVDRLDYNYRVSGGADLMGSKQGHARQGGLTGKDYQWGSHQKDPAQGLSAAQLVYEINQAQQVVATGKANVLAFAPAQVFRTDGPTDPLAEFGWVITQVTHQAARNAAWHSSYIAIPADRIFRLAQTTTKPTISGTIPARITSPSKYSNAYLSEDGLYRIEFLFDPDARNGNWPPAGSSRLMRLARPYAGDTYGFHMPLIDGTEVQIAFQNGDIDRGYIASALHDQTKPDLVTNLNHTRNIIRTPANNKIRLEDKDDQQHIKVATEYSKTQLNLGHLVDSKRQQRGDGFELRTDGWGAVRSGKGLFLSADAQPTASGKQLDMAEITSQLRQALQLAEALSHASQTAQADPADTDSQKNLLNDTLTGPKQAGLLISAPAGVAAGTPESIQLSAGMNLTLTAARHANLSILEKITLAAGDAISLFAQKSGIKLFAGKGKVDIQAQHDALNLQAQNDLIVTSTLGKVLITGKDEILLNAGAAYIRIKGSNIELGCPGDLIIKAATVNKQGAASMSQSFNSLPQTSYDQEIVIRTPSGKPVANRAFQLVREDGHRISGVTDAQGKTGVQKTDIGVGQYVLNLVQGK